ncbi:hypothetical protein BGX24_005277, partial [Mortierella sp. AD032]
PVMGKFIVRSELRAMDLNMRVPIDYVIKTNDRSSLKLGQRFTVSNLRHGLRLIKNRI